MFATLTLDVSLVLDLNGGMQFTLSEAVTVYVRGEIRADAFSVGRIEQRTKDSHSGPEPLSARGVVCHTGDSEPAIALHLVPSSSGDSRCR